jgi:phosphatidylinositol kinase/protein kinase (PI-3  family)
VNDRKVHGSLHAFLPALAELSFADASQFLYSLIIIPGSFDALKPLIRIQSIVARVAVIKLKRIEMRGTDGSKHPFILKTSENTRLDERLMQLFDLLSGRSREAEFPTRRG